MTNPNDGLERLVNAHHEELKGSLSEIKTDMRQSFSSISTRFSVLDNRVTRVEGVAEGNKVDIAETVRLITKVADTLDKEQQERLSAAQRMIDSQRTLIIRLVLGTVGGGGALAGGAWGLLKMLDVG